MTKDLPILVVHDQMRLAVVARDGSTVAGRPSTAAFAPQPARPSISLQPPSGSPQYLVAVIPITTGLTATLKWSVIVAVPTELAFAPAREVQIKILIWGFVTSLVVAVVLWFAAMLSMRPLIQLADTVRSSNHARNFRPVPFITRTDEIGLLARSWSTLLERIDENSAQLASTNRDLTRAITDTATAEKRARKSAEQYLEIFEAVTEALLIFDSHGVLVSANRAACELYGYPQEELLGRDGAELIQANDTQNARSFFSEVSAGLPFYAETVVARKDAIRVAIAVRGRVFEHAGQKHLLALVRSIDEEKRLARQLEQTARMDSLGRLSATIAHEINNVLMGIMPFAEIIERRHHDDRMLRNAATHINRSIERGRRITQEVLHFTRATEPLMRPFCAKEWLSNLAPQLSALSGNSIRLTLTCDDESLMLLGDPVQLEQVLSNLAVNARDAMRGTGDFGVEILMANWVTLQLFAGIDRPEEVVHIRAGDTGPGIPVDVRQHIFEPLFTTKGGSGTGLGLAIVHQIVTLHGGQICVESSEGQGTVFHILLPKATAALMSIGEGPSFDVSGRRVLIVEDEESVAAGLVALLDVEGFTTHHVARGTEALAAVHSFRPDVIILDIGLPDISGIEVYRRLKEAGAVLPTVFSTGHGDEDALKSVVEQGKVAFLLKPYDFERLRTAMGEVLAP